MYIDNSNIYTGDLDDGVHLNYEGNKKFISNLLNCCTTYNPFLYPYLWLEYDDQIYKGKNSVHEQGDASESSSKSPINNEVNNLSSFEKNPNSDNVFTTLRDLRIREIGRVIIATLNINSMRNKFDQLKFIIKGNIDILVITETKLDNSFPEGQFFIEGYSKPFRFDRNSHGGGIMIYVREDIPCKQLIKHTFPEDVEGIFF